MQDLLHLSKTEPFCLAVTSLICRNPSFTVIFYEDKLWAAADGIDPIRIWPSVSDITKGQRFRSVVYGMDFMGNILLFVKENIVI